MGDDPTQSAILAVIDGATLVAERMESVVTGALFRLTPPLPPFVLAQWRTVAGDLTGFLAELRAEVVAMGDTWTIRGAAQQWVSVAAVLKGAGAEIEAGQLVADDQFAGTAAAAYRAALPAQRAAYGAVFKDVADRVAAELDELADLTSAYLSAAAQLALELVLGIVTLGRSVIGVTAAEVLRAVASFSVGINSTIETWLEALIAFADHSGDIAMRWLALRQATDRSELPGGAWPVAAVPGFARTRGP